MKVYVHTDRNIHADAGQAQHIETDLSSALERFSDDLTRVDVQLSDESAGRKTGDDIHCLLEARPARQDAVTVAHRAATVTEACQGATDKLEALLTHKFDRLNDKDGRDTIRGR